MGFGRGEGRERGREVGRGGEGREGEEEKRGREGGQGNYITKRTSMNCISIGRIARNALLANGFGDTITFRNFNSATLE